MYMFVVFISIPYWYDTIWIHEKQYLCNRFSADNSNLTTRTTIHGQHWLHSTHSLTLALMYYRHHISIYLKLITIIWSGCAGTLVLVWNSFVYIPGQPPSLLLIHVKCTHMYINYKYMYVYYTYAIYCDNVLIKQNPKNHHH